MTPAGIRAVVAVAASKGGVGKTTLAVNLAAGFARRGASVGLLDLDLTGPDLPTMLVPGRLPKAVFEGGELLPLTSHGVSWMSAASLPEPLDGSLLSRVRWGELDLLFVDLPPGAGAIPEALFSLGPLRGAVLVSTPQDISVHDAKRFAASLKRAGVGILGLIENMSFHVCSACGHRDNILGHGGAAEASAKLGLTFLGAVPIDSEVRKCSDSGMPVVLKPKESPARDALLHVVDRLAAQLEPKVTAPASP